MQLEKDLNRAIEKHPENKQLRMITDVLNEVFNVKNDSKATTDEGRNLNERGKEEAVKTLEEEVCNEIDKVEVDKSILEQMEIVDFLNSRERIKEMTGIKDVTGLSEREKRDLVRVPSFSLGPEIEIVNQVCHDINTKHEDITEEVDFVTPKPLLREKSTRQLKLGPYAKSPYVNRVIDINDSYNKEDITMWRYMNLENKEGM